MARKLLRLDSLRCLVHASVRMNKFPVSLGFVATVLLSGILMLIGIVNMRDRAVWMDPTDGVFWAESERGLRAAAIDPGGPGSHAGIRKGDQLVFVNGNAVQDLGEYSNLIYRTNPGAFLSYTLTNGTANRSVTVQIGSKSLLAAKDRFRALLAFLHLGVGIFVLVRGRRFPRVFHFYLVCLTAFVVYLFSYTPRMGTLDWWVYGLSVLAFILLPALFVHFCLRFPVEAAAGGKWILLLYLPALLLGITHLLWITGHLASLGLPRTARSSGILDQIHWVYFSVSFIGGGALLLKHRFEALDLMVRQQMKWIRYGVLAGIVPFSMLYVAPTLLGVRANTLMEASMLFLALIPLSLGYALVHYRLMDVEAIARRSAAYFIASSLLLSLYLLFVLVLGRIFQWIAPQADFLAIALAVLAIALLFAPLRNVIQERLDRLFYRNQFAGRSTLRDFAQTLSAEISLVPLSRSILERIAKVFQIDKAAIFLSDPARADHFRPVYSLNADTPLLASLFRADEMVDSRDSETRFLKSGTNCLHPSSTALKREGLFYLQDLMLGGKRVGIIALGQLPKDHHFSTEDLDLLAVLAGYAAMALENANLYHSIEAKALELEHLKAYTENIIESINVAVLALDLGGRITSCNRAFEALFNTTRQQIIGLAVEKFLPADVITSIRRVSGRQDWEPGTSPVNIFKLSIVSHPGSSLHISSAIDDAGGVEPPLNIPDIPSSARLASVADGSPIYTTSFRDRTLGNRPDKRLIVNLSLIPMQAPAKGDSGSLIVMDDITGKVQLEDQLLQAEKLSSIGLLAAGIAHEVNTPIAGISSYTQMLLKDTPETDRRKQILQKIEKQTFRAAEIVRGLLNFSRLNSSEFKDLDINQLIEDSLALLNHQFQLNNIKVESCYDPALPPVFGNTGKLQQVFVNLFLNARDAMPSGGEIAVQTGMNESMIVVDISDTGAGITEENIRRIFDPFFTTKSIGKGTGLGLAVTYGIIQEHGGGIFVDSSSEKGTHFRVKLPTRLH
jgi:two-component system NtrC family sensor kinase